MSQPNDLQQSLCGDPQCLGSSCETCRVMRETSQEYERITCPHKVSNCCADNLCDKCYTTQFPTQ